MSLDAPREGDGSSVVMEIPAHSADGPLSVLERKERQEAVKEAISSLPPNQRMAVILHRFEELSYKEIAGVLNCSVAAVESLLHRAKLSLRVRLEGYFHDEPQVSIHSKVKDIEGLLRWIVWLYAKDYRHIWMAKFRKARRPESGSICMPAPNVVTMQGRSHGFTT